MHDRTADGRSIRLLVVIDEYTRECLAIDVARRLNSDDVLERLSWLMATRAVPAHIRSDNGPEMTASYLLSTTNSMNTRSGLSSTIRTPDAHHVLEEIRFMRLKPAARR